MTPENTQPLDLEAIERRANAATAGPWVKCCHSARGGDWWTVCRAVEVEGVLTALSGRQAFRVMATGQQGADDAALVTHAREDIAALIAEVRRLRALESPLSKGRECWVLWNRGGNYAIDRTREIKFMTPDEAKESAGIGNEWVRMVEAPSKGDGEPSARSGLREASPLAVRPTLAEAIAACPVLAALTETHDAAFCSYCLAMEPKTERSEVPNPSSGEGSNPQSPSRNLPATPEETP